LHTREVREAIDPDGYVKFHLERILAALLNQRTKSAGKPAAKRPAKAAKRTRGE